MNLRRKGLILWTRMRRRSKSGEVEWVVQMELAAMVKVDEEEDWEELKLRMMWRSWNGACNCYVDVVLCLKGSDDDDVHNHLAISDLVSIRWIWKVWILENLYSGKVFVLWLFREKEGGLQVDEVEDEVEEVHVDRSEKIPSQGSG